MKYKKATERAPVFSGVGDTTRRIISAPNGLWQAQIRISDDDRHDEVAECKKHKGCGKREHSNWKDSAHSLTTKEVALRQLSHQDITA